MQPKQAVIARDQIAKKLKRKSTRKRLMRTGLIGINLLMLVGIVAFVVQTPRSSEAAAPLAASQQVTSTAVNPLDQLSSASIAQTVTNLTRIPEATAVANQADSEKAELTMAAATDSVVVKPQVVATALKSRADIHPYVVQAGDTISSIADKFGVTSDSIRWSNSLSGNTVAAGTKLTIPPVNGIVYTVQNGDTVDSLAKKFNASTDKIIGYNDAERSGIHAGEVILIPDGTKAAQVVRSVSSSYSGYGWGGTAQYGFNGYDYGYCTYWVAKLRAAAGNPVPTNLGNAATWAINARAFGLPVGTTPRVGAAVVTSTRGAGHVAYVTAVNGDGTITISEMNHLGWNVTDTRNIPADGYNYIY